MNTPARATANRENASHSTGPKTPEGKRNSSRNAITTALTGRTVLLSSDDVALYEAHRNAYRRKFRPLTGEENALVQSIADTDWRLGRIPHLLLALEAKGREDFADSFPEISPEARALRIELEVQLKYEKQIRNFSLQESRLHRRRTLDLAELRTMQREREIARAEDLSTAAKLYLAAQHESRTFDPADLGFDFSIDEVRCYLTGKHATAVVRQHYPKSIANLPGALFAGDLRT